MTKADDLPDSEVWIASGDYRVALVDMTESHLRNATKYMQKALRETTMTSGDETELEEMSEKLRKLEGEIERRLNSSPEERVGTQRPPESLLITEAMRKAEHNYRKMMGDPT